METAVNIINYFKSKFKTLLVLFVIVLGLITVQYIGSYESFLWKYGIGLGLSIPAALVWYRLEHKFSESLESDHQRSVVWILLFLITIVLGSVHVIQKEIAYQYEFPMCDCDEEDDRNDRVGAICDDGVTSYSTGRGTCSEHDGVKKWQCACD